jgi:hypothetical protein
MLMFANLVSLSRVKSGKLCRRVFHKITFARVS